METYEAKVIEKDKEHYLALEIPGNILSIPITEDVPIEIQKVFNHLIVALKGGAFEFKIKEKQDGDIFYHIAKEYILQLNTELLDTYKEMEEYGLLDNDLPPILVPRLG